MGSNYQPEEFWKISPETSRLLSNKKHVYRFSYLLLLQYFNHHKRFFNHISELPKEFIKFGINTIHPELNLKEISAFFNQKSRFIQKYKSEIRHYFGFRSFSSIPQKKLFSDLSLIFYRCPNDATLIESIIDYLTHEQIETPDPEVLSDLVHKLKVQEQETLFKRLSGTLNRDHKRWIDSDLLMVPESGEGLRYFLRQDSGSSNKKAIEEEIERLRVLRVLPLEQFGYIEGFPQKQLSILIRRFLSNTPQQLKRRPEESRYSLAVLFCYQRAQTAVDNLIEHLLNTILAMKK